MQLQLNRCEEKIASAEGRLDELESEREEMQVW